MITTYSKPTKSHIWSYFSGPIRFLFWVALIGNLISGVTELGILKRMLGDVLGTGAALVLAILLSIAIELVYSIFSTMAAKSWFEIVRIRKEGTAAEREDLGKLLYIAIFSTVVAALVITLSIGVSTEGKTDLVDEMVTMPDSLKADASLATQMTSTAALKLGSDTMSVNSATLTKINAETSRINTLIAPKRSKIIELKDQFKDHQNSTWYPKQIKANENAIKNLEEELKAFKATNESERLAAVNNRLVSPLKSRLFEFSIKETL